MVMNGVPEGNGGFAAFEHPPKASLMLPCFLPALFRFWMILSAAAGVRGAPAFLLRPRQILVLFSAAQLLR